MAITQLRRRLERLETTVARVGSFDKRIRQLAVGMEVDPERLLALAKGHEAELGPSMDDAGGITWPAFCQIYELLADAAR